jgi:hypothetical protein
MDNATSQPTPRPLPTLRSSLLTLASLGLLATGCGGAEPTAAAPMGATLGGPTNSIVQTASDGAVVNVYLNHSPTITALPGAQEFPLDAAGHVFVRAQLAVTASDEDGDDLSYTWSTPNCPGAVLTFPDASDHRQVELLAGPDIACLVEVEVRDVWPGGSAPAGTGLAAARGGSALGRLQLSRPPTVTVGP